MFTETKNSRVNLQNKGHLCLVEIFKLPFLQHRGYGNKMECLNLKITDPESSKYTWKDKCEEKKKSTLSHIIIKNKEKKKKNTYLQRAGIRITLDFSSKIMQARGEHSEVFIVLNNNNKNLSGLNFCIQ